MTFGDIVLVPFPFTDQTASKVRPAVVLADVQFGQEADLVLACITSNTDKPFPHDVPIADGHQEFRKTGLKHSSLIRTHKMVGLQKSLIHRRLGALGGSHVQELKNKLVSLLSLNP